MARKGPKKIRPDASLDKTVTTDDWQDSDDMADDAGDLLVDRQEQVVGDEPAQVPARHVPTPPRPSDVPE